MNIFKQKWREFNRKYDLDPYSHEMKCFGCDEKIRFWNSSHIEVNCHTDGRHEVKGLNFFRQTRGCTNPLCLWSLMKVKD